MSKYNPEEYQKNKEKYKQRQQKYKSSHKEVIAKKQRKYRKKHGNKVYKEAIIRRRTKLREKLTIFLSDKSCIVCGENRRACLCFHHKNPEEKKDQIPYMVSKCHSWDTILKEIDKCEILCANCHLIKHNGEKHDAS